jgi:hypothetical protein
MSVISPIKLVASGCLFAVTVSAASSCRQPPSVSAGLTCETEAASSLQDNSQIQPWFRSFSRPTGLSDVIDKPENGTCTHLTGRPLAHTQASRWNPAALLIAVTTMVSSVTVTKTGGSISDPLVWVYQFKSPSGESMLGVVMNKVGVQRVVESKLRYSPDRFHSIGPDWKIDGKAAGGVMLLPTGDGRSAWIRQGGALNREDIVIDGDQLLDSATGRELRGEERTRAVSALRSHSVAWRHELWIK